MNSFSLIILLFTFYSCQNQNKVTKKNYKEDIQSQNKQVEDINYFIGDWNKDSVSITEENTNIQTVQKQQCDTKSYWNFKKSNNNVLLTKLTLVDNCSKFIKTKPSIVNYKKGRLNYLIDDIRFDQNVNILDSNKFEISEKEYIGGKHVIIKTIFKR